MSTTVILGAGIIGVSTAFYLSQHQPGSTIHLVEPSPELFASASGKAAGFLAKDWFSPRTAALGALSFDEHQKLAEAEGGREKWGYSMSKTFSHAAAPVASGGTGARGDDWLRHGGSRASVVEAIGGLGESPSWLRRVEGDDVQVIAEEGTTGQVEPLRLCQFLLQRCLDSGVHLHHPAAAISISKDVRDELSSVCIAETVSSTETDIPCTRLVIAAGAWSPQVFSTLFHLSSYQLPVSSLAGHSLVVKSPTWTKEQNGEDCHAVFSTDGAGFSPEVFSRIGGNIYLAGVNSSTIALPNLPNEAQVSPAAIKKLTDTARQIVKSATANTELEVVREDLCFRPVTPSGTPFLCRIADEHLGIAISTRPGADGGVFLAAGHGPWGISQSLGTGKIMAEMVQGRPTSADVSTLSLAS